MLNIRIKELREMYRLNQIQLAQKIGVSKQSISNWENDNIQPSIEMLIKLSKVFSVSTDYLLGLETRNFIEFSGLNETQKIHIQQIIDDIVGKSED